MKYAIAIAAIAGTVTGRCDFELSQSHHLTGPGDVTGRDHRIVTSNHLGNEKMNKDAGVRTIQNKDWKKGLREYGDESQGQANVWNYMFTLKPGADPKDARCDFKTIGFALNEE
jgi:hypothetical protein